MSNGYSASNNDQSASGVSNSGNVSANYAPPTHPAFPFSSAAGAGVLGGSLTGSAWVAIGAAMLAAYMIWSNRRVQ